MLGFSAPFNGCVREFDGVNLSAEAGKSSVVFFLSPAEGAETGVEGRGEGAAVFCRNSS